MSLGSTWTSAPQSIQDEFEHCVIGLRHSGHCSAPRMSVPPFFCVAELEAEPVPVALFLSLLHAAVISTKLNKRQRRALPRRCRLTYSDLLVGSQGDAVVTALPGVGVAPWRASPGCATQRGRGVADHFLSVLRPRTLTSRVEVVEDPDADRKD